MMDFNKKWRKNGQRWISSFRVIPPAIINRINVNIRVTDFLMDRTEFL